MKRIALSVLMIMLSAAAFCQKTVAPQKEHVPPVTEGGGRLVGDYLKSLVTIDDPVVEVTGLIKTKGFFFSKEILLVEGENVYKLKLVAESDVARDQLLKMKNKPVTVKGPLNSVENVLVVQKTVFGENW